MVELNHEVLDSYRSTFLRYFPNFSSFREDGAYLVRERRYKQELSGIFKTEILPLLNDLPPDATGKAKVGQSIINLFTRKLTEERYPQNLASWRDIDFTRAMQDQDKADFAEAVAALVAQNAPVDERLDRFIAFLSAMTRRLGVQANAGQRRVISSFFLFLSDPGQFIFVKTKVMNRFLSKVAGYSLPPGELTGEAYVRVLETARAVNDYLQGLGWQPEDLIDVQSFMWVVESYGKDDPEPAPTPTTGVKEPKVNVSTSRPLNLILYGPPGTGKTYRTTRLAVEICDGIVPESPHLLQQRYQELIEEKRIRFVTFHQSYGYEDFIEGIRPEVVGGAEDEAGERMIFQPRDGVFKSIADAARSRVDEDSVPPNHVLIIDEINRGNIAKIFGELITLIEPSRRLGAEDELRATLPVSQAEFGVPQNLFLLGTMNTADRSIALLDSALRRRFHFEELMPDTKLIEGTDKGRIQDKDGEAIDLRQLLATINRRIEFLQGRDHQIGHAYLMKVRDEESLRRAFLNQIMPLLQEYFHEDLRLVQAVLGRRLIQSEVRQAHELFPDLEGDDLVIDDERYVFKVNPAPSGSDFRSIYAR